MSETITPVTNEEAEVAELIAQRNAVAADSPAANATEAPAAEAPKTNYSAFWKRANYKEKPAEPAPAAAPDPTDESEGETEDSETEDTGEASTQAPKQPGGGLSKEAVEKSSRIAVNTLELTMVTIFRPLINWQFKKRLRKVLSDEEIMAGAQFARGELHPATEEQQRVKNYFTHFLNQRDEKITGLKFTEEDKEDLNFAFGNYMEVEQKQLPASYLVAMAVAGVVGKRGIDAFVGWD